MAFVLTRINSLTSSGLNLFLRATPWVINLTSGGADQLVSSLLIGGINLVSPVIRKSKRKYSLQRQSQLVQTA